MFMTVSNETPPKFLSRYSGVKKVVTVFEKPSLTDQSFKDDCDLGTIIDSYVRTRGRVVDTSTFQYMDTTSVKDYQDAMLTVAEANSNFEMLPSKDRDRFKTVENYLEFISDKNNLKESYEKGYIDRSSVDLMDVYPERFKNEITDKKPSVNEYTEPSPSASEKMG